MGFGLFNAILSGNLVMKVLLVSSDNSDRSGAFLSMCNLAYYLKNCEGVECRVLLPYNGNGTRILETYGIEYKIITTYDWIIPIDCGNFLSNVIMRLKKYIKYGINLWNLPQIDKYLEEFEPDIVHINTICTYVAAISAKKHSIPVVWHIREFLEEDWHNRIHFPKYGYSLVSSADKIICISHCIKDKFKTILDNNNITVILNGVRKDKYICQDIKDNNEINIICVGGLLKQKGQELLVRALNIVKTKYDGEFHVYFLGTGPCMEDLICLTKELKLESIVSFVGYCEDTENYYRKAHISVVPSYFEPFGRVTVEAMMSAAMVIGSDTAGTKELIGDDNEHGMLFKCGDFEDLAEKLLYAMENANVRNEIVARAMVYAVSELTAESNANKVFKIYQELYPDREGKLETNKQRTAKK